MAVSRAINSLLTKVGPGTPGGALLRRYWMPVGPASEITAKRPKKRVRLLGEDLVLFRDGGGRYGLIPERCPHRGASLYFGFAEDDGLRCAYHGWKFAAGGACIDQPFEPTEKLKKLACRPEYKVEELGGILFAYIGPLPAPLLPRWEGLVRPDVTRKITVLPIHHCNWVQAQENSHDPVHPKYLHAEMLKHVGYGPEYASAVAYFERPIENFSFELVHEPAWSGIRKIRMYGGDRPERELGHPAIFPNILVAPQGKEYAMHWRVPVDDEHTYILWFEFTPTEDGSEVVRDGEPIPVTYLPHPLRPDGEYDLSLFPNQDLMAWETQGAIADRSSELLGASDRGVTMFRKLLREQIERVRKGQEPVGVIRDSAHNQQIALTLSGGLAQLTREIEAAT